MSTTPPGSGNASRLSEAEKIRGLRWRIAHGATNTVFCVLTVFGSLFPLFLDEMGLAKSQIGFVQSLIPFSGLLALVAAPWIARYGFKRTYLTFWTLRKLVIALLLPTPYLLRVWGPETTTMFVCLVVGGFAVCRALGEAAYYPWTQETVPNSMRGKVAALTNISGTVLACVTLPPAAYMVYRMEGLWRYVVIIAFGVAAGLLSCYFASLIPGGAPQPYPQSRLFASKMRDTLRDRNFVRYLAGFGLVTIGSSVAFSFLPLFMKEEVGLSRGVIIGIQVPGYLAILMSSYFWGWAADRYGSKPVMLTGLAFYSILPLAWWLAPRSNSWSVPAAAALIFLATALMYAWNTGSARQLFVSVVPERRKTEYLALYCGWVSLVSGCGPLLAGALLDVSRDLDLVLGYVRIGPYAPLLIGSVPLMLAGMLLLRRVRDEGDLSAVEFAGMFLKGNPLLAMESMVRYSFALDEPRRIRLTERLGHARSPLTVEELIEALSDPGFNVRFEAIISIARTRRDPRLTTALIEILHGDEPDLSVVAAWALARLGDRRAIPALRAGLDSGFPLLRARCARALATLNDTDSVPILLEHFRGCGDAGERLAYSAALGRLHCTDAIPDMLTLLKHLHTESARGEIALSLARCVDAEPEFIRLWRDVRAHGGAALSRAVLALEERLPAGLRFSMEPTAPVDDRNEPASGADETERSIANLLRILESGAVEHSPAPHAGILYECAQQMKAFGDSRPEYAFLAAAVLRSALGKVQRRSR